jgi:hypothetical protein
MNKKEYRKYQERVENFLQSEGIKIICVKDYDQAGGFSKFPCECCGSGLGGERYTMTADNGFEYDVCRDCAYYLECGQLDDRTMMEIKEEEL